MRGLLLVIGLLINLLHNAQSQPWQINSASIKFKIKNAGFNVDGSFKGLTGTLNFDKDKSFGNLIDVSLDAGSINTGISSRDNHLKKEEFFNVVRFPKITMKATLFTREKDGTFKGYFKLGIKGVTKDIILPFRFTETSGKGLFSAEFKINRRDFTIGGPSMVLSDDVKIAIEVSVTKY